MDTLFNKRISKKATINSVRLWLALGGLSIIFLLLDIKQRSISGTNPNENFSGEVEMITYILVAYFFIFIAIYLVNFYVQRKEIFPDIQVDRIPIVNPYLGEKGQMCFYIDIYNKEIEKITELSCSLKTIVVSLSNGQMYELIIDPEDSFLLWKNNQDKKITIDGVLTKGHAVLKIVEEGSFQGEDALFARFMTNTNKDTKLMLDEVSPNNYMLDLWLEIEFSGFFKGNEIHPRRYYYNIGYRKNGGGIKFIEKHPMPVAPHNFDIVFNSMSNSIINKFKKATKKIPETEIYLPSTRNMFFKAERKIEFILKEMK